jgi:tetratricopeptide (TPR) repeat protein
VVELPSLDTVHRCFKPGRTRLDQELVVDIARALLGDDLRAAEWRQVHRVVTGRVAAAVVTVRRGLPELQSEFVGRDRELARLFADQPSAGVVVLHGMAGVGKTTLALHAAHALIASGRFTDLQLSVNLRGHDLEYPPADPGLVLDGMLRQLDYPAYAVHGLDLRGRLAQLRRLLAGKRALLLLDDASGSSQVLPLLPDSETCLTLITSRRELTELKARHVPLSPFTRDEAHDLLNRVVGSARLEQAPQAAAGLAEAVGHLPLAVALMAGQVRKTPDWTLQDHLTRLTERLSSGSLDKGVAVAIESSYTALPASRRRLMRLLAIHPGRSVDAYAVAALAGVDVDTAACDLDALAADSLLVRRGSDRFGMHDLVRLFAADRASDLDAPSARNQALTRSFDYYRLATYRAARLHEPHYVREMELAAQDLAVPGFPDRAAATRWLDLERPNLITCALYCADHGQPDHASDMAGLLHHYLYAAGHLHDAQRLDQRASQVSEGLDRARALGRLSSVYSWLGRLTEARELCLQALAEIDAAGDVILKARCLANYGILCRRLGRFHESISTHREAMKLFLACGDESLAAQQRYNVGLLHILLGQHEQGVDALLQALTVAQKTSDRTGEGDALGGLGVAALLAGRPEEALDRHEQALRLFVELGDRAGEGAARNGCGAALTASGRPEQALQQHDRALDIAKDISDRECEAEALIEAGRALHRLSRFRQALDWQTRALRLSEDTGNAWQQARAHTELARVRDAMGDHESARTHEERATVLRATLHPTSAVVTW